MNACQVNSERARCGGGVEEERASSPTPQVELRGLRGPHDMARAQTLQERVWGAGDPPVSKDLLIALSGAGALVAGAFAPHGELVGFVLGFPTGDPQVQHSHRVAVLGEWRRCGLGARLKWFQREWCLARGVRAVRWTFDPLRAANAHLNVQRLGATAATYLPDHYGEMGGINAGVPSDRLLAEWDLASERVRRRRDEPRDEDLGGATLVNFVQGDLPVGPTLGLDAPRLAVRVPPDFGALLGARPEAARAWRRHVRLALEHYLGRGYVIRGFARTEQVYLLERGSA